MHYYLDSSLCPVIGDEMSRSIALLIMSHREGKHLVSGDRCILDELSRLTNWGLDSRATAKSIRNDIPSYGRIHCSLLAYIRVVGGTLTEGGVIQHELGGGRTRIDLHYSRLMDSMDVQSSELLAENLRDGDLYFQMAQAWAGFASSQFSNIAIGFQTISGGGSGTAAEIKKRYTSVRPMLCIVDSDRLAPGSSVGSTARSALGAISRSPPIHRAIQLNCHEVENLIPIHLLEKTAAEKHNSKAVEMLRRFRAAGIPCHWIDLKRGLRCTDLQHPYLSRHKPLILELCSARDCGSDTCTDMRCDCWLIPPFGDGLLQRVVDYVTHNGYRNAFRREDFEDELKELIPLLLSWGCAARRKRT